MPDYQSNAKKLKEQKELPKGTEKKSEPIVSEVIIRKKPIGRKLKDLIIEADMKSVAGYVFFDVLIPQAKIAIVDVFHKGIDKAIWGDSAVNHRRVMGRGHPRTIYNSPINRDYRDEYRGLTTTRYTSINQGRAPRFESPRLMKEELILPDKAEADLVLERMADILNEYEVVTVTDLNEMLDRESSYVDNKWGWTDLRGARVEQIREGWIINFPPIEPIT